MDLSNQIISQALSRDSAGNLRRTFERRQKDLESKVHKRAELLAQPALLENRVVAHAKPLGLSTKQIRARRGESKFNVLERQAEDTPMEGFGSELMQTYTAALNDPQYINVSNKQLLSAVAKNLMNKPDEEGKTRTEKAHRYKWRADTSLGNLFGIFGGDEDVKKLPGYEKYLERQKEMPVDEWHTSPGTAAAVGAGFTGALMLGSKYLGKGLLVTPHPVAKLAGAAVIAIPEFMAFDAVHNIIAKTEWGRAREGTWRKLGADTLIGGGFAGAGARVARVGIRKAAEKLVVSKQTTDLLINSGFISGKAVAARDARIIAEKAQEKANLALIKNISKDDVINTVAALSREVVKESTKDIGKVIKKRAEQRIAKGTLAASIKKAQRSIPVNQVTSKNIGSKFAQLSELRADMALRKTQKIKDVKVAVAEQLRVQELANRQKRLELLKKKTKIRQDIITKERANKLKLYKYKKDHEQKVQLQVKNLLAKQLDTEALVKETVAKKPSVLKPSHRQQLRTELKAKRKLEAEKVKVAIAERVKASEALERKQFAERLWQISGAKEKAEKEVKLLKKEVNRKEYLTKKKKENIQKNLKVLLAREAEEQAELASVVKVKPEVIKKKAFTSAEQAELKALINETDEGVKQIGADVNKNIVSLEEAGFVEYAEGGSEIRKGGKDLVDLMQDSWKLYGVGAAVFGSIPLLSLFAPPEIEASPLVNTLKTAGVKVSRSVAKTAEKVKTEKAMEAIAKTWKDAGLLHIPSVGKEKTSFQKVLRFAPWAAETHGDLIKNIRSTTAPMFLIKHGSPYWAGRALYKINPLAEVGNLMSATGNIAADSMTVVSRILKDTLAGAKGGLKVTKDVMDTMKPIAEKFSADIPAHRAVAFEIKELGDVYSKLYKALGKEQGLSLNKTERRVIAEVLEQKTIKGRIGGVKHQRALAELEKKMNGLKLAEKELKPSVDAFIKEWGIAAEGLAKKHSSSRIALACEDTASYEAYPWLKDLMKPEEEEAVIWLKNLMNTYKGRMAEAGHDVIEGAYMHHAWHPSWLDSAAKDRLKSFGIHSRGIPYSKFFRRSEYSKMMMPDVNYIMPKYLMDTERRIQWSGFWGKGEKNSWYAHRRWVEKFGTDQQKMFWKKITDASIPPAPTKYNTLANIYASFEVARLLAFSGSVPLKHYFKLMGTASTLGIKNFASTYFSSMNAALSSAKNTPEVISIARRVGIKIPETVKGKKKLVNEVCNSYITQMHRMNMIADLDFESMLPNKAGLYRQLTDKLQTFNRWGSVGVRAIEAVDRHHSVLAGWEMAAKKGLTAKDSLYSIYSNIFVNNFLSGAGNPTWMKNPLIRSTLLFQNTPFKIMERRLWTGYRAGKDVKTAIGIIRHQNIKKTLEEMAGIGKYILKSEKELKQNLIFDALTMTKDHMGTPAIKQAMTEMVLSTALLTGGGLLGINLMSQVWHIPILAHGAKAPTIAVNPFLSAAFRTKGEREEAIEYDVDQDFIVTQFLHNWLRSSGYIPQTANKVIRITKNDIPEIYKDSKWQYFFSVPSIED